MTTEPLTAELLISTGCSHCPVVLDALSALLKKGVIARLSITNINEAPERAQQLGARSVPWLQLGPFTLTGAYSLGEITEWAELAGSIKGMSRYIEQELKQGKFSEVESLLKSQPQWLSALIPLMENEETDMKTRFGVDALIESLASEIDLSPLISGLGKLSASDRPSLRTDATHYLSLTRHNDAVPFLRARLNDENEEVREIAREGLEECSSS